MSKLVKVLVGLCGTIAVAAALLWQLGTRGDVPAPLPLAASSTAERGKYLALVGNCALCHTAQGGLPYAGGRGIDTPFGAVFSSNLTPDVASGIGSWTTGDFWRAMHHGKSKNGRLLYPVFPYTSYTLVTRDDSDALFAYLTSLAAVAQPQQANTLGFPYNTQLALSVWRALYFRSGNYQDDASKSADWNRGAYLTQSLGHCSACHAARNALGATKKLDLAGGLIPVRNWYAPSLVDAREAGLQGWSIEDIVALFKTGRVAQASVNGPMAEVVLGSTQHYSNADLTAMAVYLKALPPAANVRSQVTAGSATARGSKLYEQHCAQCHGDDGKGVADAYPALAGNRAVVMPQIANLVQMVLGGGYAPATAANPRPFGMPPYVLVLTDNDVAEVLSHIRGSWGNHSAGVSAVEVMRIRANGSR